MIMLHQIIYCSSAKISFDEAQLKSLVLHARDKNEYLGITGVLLYSEGTFFQVLEGSPPLVGALMKEITNDHRHTNISIISNQSISTRSFPDWTMAYAGVSPSEISSVLSPNDESQDPSLLTNLKEVHALKLMQCLMSGQWHSRFNEEKNFERRLQPSKPPSNTNGFSMLSKRDYSFAFQPIINIASERIFSFEALVRTPDNQPSREVFRRIAQSDLYQFDRDSRELAIQMAAKLGLECKLNLNVLPLCISKSSNCIESLLKTVQDCELKNSQIVLELIESQVMEVDDLIRDKIKHYRSTGLTFAIDDFGSGFAGLSLLADFQPDFIKLDPYNIRSIQSHKARQAIVKGVLQTCEDLAIQVVAEGVECSQEFAWLKDHGVILFQGTLFAEPRFEQLSLDFSLPGN